MDKIEVLDFVNKYKELTDDAKKHKYVESIIARTYCPVLEKKLALQQMFDKSLIEDKNGIKYIDMLINKINVTTAILLLYTNLNVVKSENKQTNNFDDYDLLKENNILNEICNCIGESEMNELMNINGMIMDTFYNQQNIESFIAKQVTRFGTLIGVTAESGAKQLASVLEDEKKMKYFADKLNGIMSKMNKFKN